MMDQKKNSIVKEDEIDLIELAKLIWSRRLFIAKITGVFVVLGLIIALTSPEEYETSCVLIPEAINEQGKLGGSLGGLASIAGLDLNGLSSGTYGINPALYQSVSRSTPFLMSIMKQEFYFSEVGDSLSLYKYYQDHLKIGVLEWVFSFPGKALGFLKNDKASGKTKSAKAMLSITKKEQSIIKDLQSRIFVEMDWELNVVRIEVEMQDPLVAAQMALYTQNYITEYVTNYSISKSTQQFQMTSELYEARKKDFEKVQIQLANFRDENRNVTTARIRAEEEKLQAEFNLAFNVYNQLAQKLEAIRLQVEENRPVFTVLEPVKVPVDKSKPKRMLIMIGFSLAGVFISALYIIMLEIRNA